MSESMSLPHDQKGWETLLKTDINQFNAAHEQWRADNPRKRLPLTGANLGGANLEGANLEGANLMGANLMGAGLEEAKLGKANLYRAKLMEANLYRAILEGTDLENAILENVKGAISLSAGELDSRGKAKNFDDIEKIDRDFFDHSMLLVDHGDDGVMVKRGDCLWKTAADTFTHWDQYSHSNADRVSHRQQVMIPALVDALGQAVERCEETKLARESDDSIRIEFPKAAEILADLKGKYSEKYPDAFEDKSKASKKRFTDIVKAEGRTRDGRG